MQPFQIDMTKFTECLQTLNDKSLSIIGIVVNYFVCTQSSTSKLAFIINQFAASQLNFWSNSAEVNYQCHQ